MAYFAVNYEYVNNNELIAAVRPKHREFLTELHEKRMLVASGPLLQTVPPAALLIMRAESEEQIAEALDHDPFAEKDIITQRTITAWNPAVGVFAAND